MAWYYNVQRSHRARFNACCVRPRASHTRTNLRCPPPLAFPRLDDVAVVVDPQLKRFAYLFLSNATVTPVQQYKRTHCSPRYWCSHTRCFVFLDKKISHNQRPRLVHMHTRTPRPTGCAVLRSCSRAHSLTSLARRGICTTPIEGTPRKSCVYRSTHTGLRLRPAPWTTPPGESGCTSPTQAAPGVSTSRFRVLWPRGQGF